MSKDPGTPLPDTQYWRTYQGPFSGILTWDGFDDLWARLNETQGAWYVFDPEKEAPVKAETPEEFHATLEQAGLMLKGVRNRSYCGAVYVDDPQSPSFVKVFDPYHMGSACGGGGERVLPRWIFSRIAPDTLPPAPEPTRKGLFARIGM